MFRSLLTLEHPWILDGQVDLLDLTVLVEHRVGTARREEKSGMRGTGLRLRCRIETIESAATVVHHQRLAVLVHDLAVAEPALERLALDERGDGEPDIRLRRRIILRPRDALRGVAHATAGGRFRGVAYFHQVVIVEFAPVLQLEHGQLDHETPIGPAPGGAGLQTGIGRSHRRVQVMHGLDLGPPLGVGVGIAQHGPADQVGQHIQRVEPPRIIAFAGEFLGAALAHADGPSGGLVGVFVPQMVHDVTESREHPRAGRHRREPAGSQDRLHRLGHIRAALQPLPVALDPGCAIAVPGIRALGDGEAGRIRLCPAVACGLIQRPQHRVPHRDPVPADGPLEPQPRERVGDKGAQTGQQPRVRGQPGRDLRIIGQGLHGPRHTLIPYTPPHDRPEGVA